MDLTPSVSPAGRGGACGVAFRHTLILSKGSVTADREPLPCGRASSASGSPSPVEEGIRG